MTTKTKTTNKTDRRVAKLERELAHVRRQNRMLEFVRLQTFRAMFEFMHLPKDANEHLCRIHLLEYVKYLGHHYCLPPGWDEAHKELDIPEEDLVEHTAR
jgi:hypothetical protein